jgi:hypothetical protein
VGRFWPVAWPGPALGLTSPLALGPARALLGHGTSAVVAARWRRRSQQWGSRPRAPRQRGYHDDSILWCGTLILTGIGWRWWGALVVEGAISETALVASGRRSRVLQLRTKVGTRQAPLDWRMVAGVRCSPLKRVAAEQGTGSGENRQYGPLQVA